MISIILDIATKGKYETRKTGVALLIIGVLLGFIYVSGGTQDAQPSPMFDVLTLLTMIYLLIWGIRKRREEKSIDRSDMSELRLLEDEKLISDVSPTPSFKRYVTVKASVTGLLFLAMVNVMVAMVFYVGTGGAPINEVGVGPLLATYASLYLVLAAIVIALTFTLANLMYKKHHYWVTDKRVVWRHGVIGYSITSVPLERISDVAVSRTFWERICGVGGVVVKEMGAVPKYGYGYWYGAGSVFPTMTAVPDPEEMQKRILELIGKKGKESKLTV